MVYATSDLRWWMAENPSSIKCAVADVTVSDIALECHQTRFYGTPQPDACSTGKAERLRPTLVILLIIYLFTNDLMYVKYFSLHLLFINEMCKLHT